jgi:hypothetical protein
MGCPLHTKLARFKQGSREFFLRGPEIQTPKGSSALLPLGKLSYIIFTSSYTSQKSNP